MPEPESKFPPRLEFILGLCLGFLPWGFSLIGVTTNLLLGSIVLLVAGILVEHALWLATKAQGVRLPIRVLFVALGCAIFLGLVVPQVLHQYQMQRSTADLSHSPAPAASPFASPSQVSAKKTATATPEPQPVATPALQANTREKSALRNSASTLLSQARGLYEAGKYQSARRLCDRVLQSNPNNREAKELKTLIVMHEKIVNP
jgi:Fis1-like tetratricopeptide repeat protein